MTLLFAVLLLSLLWVQAFGWRAEGVRNLVFNEGHELRLATELCHLSNHADVKHPAISDILQKGATYRILGVSEGMFKISTNGLYPKLPAFMLGALHVTPY